MTTVSRVSPTGWSPYDDGSTISRVTPTGWQQFNSAGAPAANTKRSFIPAVIG